MIAHANPQGQPAATHPAKGFFVGAQNDAWFIVYGDAPASANDHTNHEADRTAVAKVYDESLARKLCALANAALSQPAAASVEVAGYFSYGEDSGYVEHETAKAAMDQAQEDLNAYRKDATHDNEWPGEVDSVCWGVVLQKTTAVDNSEAAGQPSFDYELAPPTPPASQPQKKCAQCKQPYTPGADNGGCPKCAPGVRISEIEFQKPFGTTAPSDNAALKEMWALMSEMVELHGMNGDNTMTDDQHARWQQAAGLAHDQLRTSGSEGAAATDA